MLFLFSQFQFHQNPDMKYLNYFITYPFLVLWIIFGIIIKRAYLEFTEDKVVYYDGFKKLVIRKSSIVNIIDNRYLFLSPIGINIGEQYRKVIPGIFESRQKYVELLNRVLIDG